MKARTESRSSSRTRSSMTTRRSRSLLPATTRRPKSQTSKRKSRGSSGRSKASATAARSTGRTSGSAKTTTDHDEIREWVESRGGHPATVKRTTLSRQEAGVLRIDFPGFSGEKSLKPVSWDQWFKVFDQRKLAFLYQNKGKSRFNKLVSRKK